MGLCYGTAPTTCLGITTSLRTRQPRRLCSGRQPEQRSGGEGRPRPFTPTWTVLTTRKQIFWITLYKSFLMNGMSKLNSGLYQLIGTVHIMHQLGYISVIWYWHSAFVMHYNISLFIINENQLETRLSFVQHLLSEWHMTVTQRTDGHGNTWLRLFNAHPNSSIQPGLVTHGALLVMPSKTQIDIYLDIWILTPRNTTSRTGMKERSIQLVFKSLISLSISHVWLRVKSVRVRVEMIH